MMTKVLVNDVGSSDELRFFLFVPVSRSSVQSNIRLLNQFPKGTICLSVAAILLIF